MFLQVYFIITFFYGWLQWHRISPKEPNGIKFLTLEAKFKIGGIVFLSILILSYIVGEIHIWFPLVFTTPVAYKYLDTIVAVLSILANLLLARKYMENWFIWIIVNIIACYIYFQKNLKNSLRY